jgi:hypothetical protein
MRVCVRRDFKFIAILLLLVSPVAALVVVNYVQRREVNRVSLGLTTTFPLGMSVSKAETSLMSLYPGNTKSYTAAECEKWSHGTVPAYTSKGGRAFSELLRSEVFE